MKILKTYDSRNHFIIASPRSGTTWISKMLNAHLEVNCVERRLFGNYADFVLDEGNNTPRHRVTLDKYVNSLMLHHGMPQSNTDDVMQSLIVGITKEERRISKKKIIVDKITPYLSTSQHVINQINKFFPKSKIIYLVRDGRDVLTSGVFHWFNKKPLNVELTDFEIKRRNAFINSETLKLERFFQDKEIEQWATEWIEPLQTIKKAKNTHKVKIVSYESLLNNTKGVLTDCLLFLAASTKPTIIDNCIETGSFKTMSNGRVSGQAKADAHIRKGVSGDWKNYFTYKDGQLFNEIAGEALVEFGYEENSNWFERLR